MKTSEHFKLARKRIARGHDRFICCALMATNPAGVTAPSRAADVIQTRMAGTSWSFTLEGWLHDNGHVKGPKDPPKDKMRQYRLAWLDSLIAEFEAKGD